MKYKVDPLSVAERIRVLMGHETEARFATRLGVSPDSVTDYLHGHVPDPATLLRIAETCGVSPDWLLRSRSEADRSPQMPSVSVATAEDAATRPTPPPVNVILNHERLDEIRPSVSSALLVKMVRTELQRSVNSPSSSGTDAAGEIAARVARRASSLYLPRRNYINATGIIIHTGWGNAHLHPEARKRLAEATGASPTGAAETLPRMETCATLLRTLTGAEAATVTTMNAANLLLVAGALAAGREIVVAARDLAEISHGARISDILQAAGARLAPVGSVNCVYIEDYARAIRSDTSLLLRIRVSNMAAVGYTAHVQVSALAELAHKHNLPCVDNLGGGSLVDLKEYGLPECPTLQQGITDRADLVLASGDKIIGGPQAGIIVGKRQFVDLLSRHPLARTCRPSKLTLAALEATLAVFVAGRAWEEIPALRMLKTPQKELRTRAAAIGDAIAIHGMEIAVSADAAECGGAVLPGVSLPTWIVRIKHPKLTEDQLHAVLLARGVIARRGQGAVILDLRSVAPEEDPPLLQALVPDCQQSAGALDLSDLRSGMR
jgi:L-seryl-tRNA(Ser) seleniumtransferase